MITDEQRNFISSLVNSNKTTSDQIDLISRLINTMADQGTLARDKDTIIEMVSQMLFKVADDHYNMGYNTGYRNGDQDGQATGRVNAQTGMQRDLDIAHSEGYETGYSDGKGAGFDQGWKAALNTGKGEEAPF